VYWGTESSSIVRLPFSDLSAAPQLVVGAQGTLRDVEVAGDRVYWANFESVNSADKNGVNRLVVPLYQNGPTIPFGIASDGLHVYVTTAGLASESEHGTLYRIPLLGGPRVKLAETQGFGGMRAVVLDCNTIYLANNGEHDVLKLAR
jgi:hypothetical protein